MSEGTPPTGFMFPMRAAEFGLSVPEFAILHHDENAVVPGSRGQPLFAKLFSFPTSGPTRLEIHKPKAGMMGAKGKDALFISQKVELVFGRTAAGSPLFAVLKTPQAPQLADDLQTFAGKPLDLLFRPADEDKDIRPDPLNPGWTLG